MPLMIPLLAQILFIQSEIPDPRGLIPNYQCAEHCSHLDQVIVASQRLYSYVA